MLAEAKKMDHVFKQRVELNYLCYEPGSSGAGKSMQQTGLPLLLFLHGAGERGNDLNLVRKTGLPQQLDNGLELPFLVLAPQCPADEWWQLHKLMRFLEYALETYPVDRKRIYLTGLSMGGYATWGLADNCPGTFAAIAPICGPYTWIHPANFRDVPVWCFHGAMDSVVPMQDSVRIVRRLRDAGADVRFTVYPDADHDSWTVTYQNPELYDWFLAH